MKIEFRKSFEKDIKKIKDVKLLRKTQLIIEEIEKLDNLQQINNIKPLKGETNYYRIRIGNYRMGIYADENVVRFVRFLHRQEIYQNFP
ncbi:MAG: type II toxin-antitoxin system RelE/ParE family toxin [Cyanobacterium sp. T60_A2020_053]|nr:type II toxin-antitoxin system RelE/ParE family toxin [Cyanobacterium sp. T60_A2020_053]